MPSTFLTLPVEVVEHVTNLLDRTGLCTVRLASKILYQKTLHHFGSTYFTVRRMDFSLNNLQTLWAISQTENLKQHVQTLFIADPQYKLGKGLFWYRVEGDPLTAHLDTRHSLGVHVFRDILRNLINCRSFHIQSPYFAGRREHYESNRLRPSDTVHIVFEVVIECRIPVKSFRIDCYHYEGLATERLQKQLYQQPKYIAAWGKLEELRLDGCPNVANFGWTRDLILHNTHLKKLTLHMDHDDTTEYLASILCSIRSCQGVQELDLKCINTTRIPLLTLLIRCRYSLRKLSIWHVVIHYGTWVQMLTALRSFKCLEHIELEWLWEFWDGRIVRRQFPALDANRVVPGSDGRKFALRYQQWKGKKIVWSVAYRGQVGMYKALEILAESAEDTI